MTQKRWYQSGRSAGMALLLMLSMGACSDGSSGTNDAGGTGDMAKGPDQTQDCWELVQVEKKTVLKCWDFRHATSTTAAPWTDFTSTGTPAWELQLTGTPKQAACTAPASTTCVLSAKMPVTVPAATQAVEVVISHRLTVPWEMFPKASAALLISGPVISHTNAGTSGYVVERVTLKPVPGASLSVTLKLDAPSMGSGIWEVPYIAFVQ